MDHSKLIKSCKKGNEKAFEELVDTFSGRLFSYFMSLTGNYDISNELLSELYLKVVRNIESCDSEKFEHWLFKIASNTFYDYLRAKERTKKLNSYLVQQHEEPKTPQGNVDNEIFDELAMNLSVLDDETREMIMLKYYSDMSFKEIAEIKGKPIGTVLSKVHRGIKHLKDRMLSNK